jgi:hypothetical protein
MDLKSAHGNQKGQAATEMILIMVLGIAILGGFFAALKQMKFLDKVAVEPFAVVSGMIECGVWKTCGISAPTPNYHPSNRVISYRPQQ